MNDKLEEALDRYRKELLAGDISKVDILLSLQRAGLIDKDGSVIQLTKEVTCDK